MIKITNFSKSYSKNEDAVHDINIVVKKGTIHGLIGPNGAGKSTIIKTLVGIYKETTGTITIDDKPVYDNPDVKQRVGYVADTAVHFFPDYTLKDLVWLYSGLYDKFSYNQFEKYNSELNLPMNRKVRKMSKGMQMQISIMLNLSINPDVLILDEPTSGLDAIVKKKVLQWIVEEVAEREMTVFISSHHIDELEKICDIVSIISNGKIIKQADASSIKRSVVKLQVVFEGDAPTDISSWVSVLGVEKMGSVHYITSDNEKFLREQLDCVGVKLAENIPLALEEAFVYIAEKERKSNENVN
ncbi:MAG: hypothetical protein ATN35_11905 [Epulopiscium sp. Nele67-Bin004]|nr:MAG: hypothetical protein ATN35_11905 [Epulopiscium sp. Nele67-Bin004]